jgi:hypothetical protein
MVKKVDAKNAERKIQEALEILKELGFPRQQQNDRSALTLLALLNIKPNDPWKDASNPLIGITPMMEFFDKHYGKRYAPNTRETVRRQTVHQFVQAALIVPNPDKPSRPTNSPKAVYQIEPSALKLLHDFGKRNWIKYLHGYLRTVETLKQLYARERDMRRIPVNLVNGREIRLSPGGQNTLVKKVIDDFCPLFTPGGHIIYVGDTQTKWAYFDPDALQAGSQDRSAWKDARCRGALCGEGLACIDRGGYQPWARKPQAAEGIERTVCRIEGGAGVCDSLS